MDCFYFFVFYHKKRVFYHKKRLVFYIPTTLILISLDVLVHLIHFCVFRDDTSSAVIDAQEALEEAKEELQRSRQVRNHGLQYHALAKLIQEHPPRAPTAQKLSKLSTTLDNLEVIAIAG